MKNQEKSIEQKNEQIGKWERELILLENKVNKDQETNENAKEECLRLRNERIDDVILIDHLS